MKEGLRIDIHNTIFAMLTIIKYGIEIPFDEEMSKMIIGQLTNEEYFTNVENLFFVYVLGNSNPKMNDQIIDIIIDQLSNHCFSSNHNVIKLTTKLIR